MHARKLCIPVRGGRRCSELFSRIYGAIGFSAGFPLAGANAHKTGLVFLLAQFFAYGVRASYLQEKFAVSTPSPKRNL